MAPLCNMGKDMNIVKSEKADFSSIISFIGGDNRKDKKRRRGDAEKKRRDRINRCLDQLEELIPYVRQKKKSGVVLCSDFYKLLDKIQRKTPIFMLCSKVDKAEVLELTVHFVKETLYERELNYRKTHMSSMMEYERIKLSSSTRENTTTVRTNERCRCGCGGPIDKRSHSTEPPISPYSPSGKVMVVRPKPY